MIDLGQLDPTLGPAGAAVPAGRHSGTVRDAAAFRAKLEAFRLEALAKHDALLKRVMTEALTLLVDANPVGNTDVWKHPRAGYVGGHSRRNWQVTVQDPQSIVEQPGASKGDALSAGYAAIGAIPSGTQKAYLVNQVPYMERLNQGWSKQAAPGWIQAALAKVMAKFARAK
jgi:hypothetical protein